MLKRNEIAAAFVGGIAASYAMDLVQDAWTARFERRRAADIRDEEVEAIASVVRFFGRAVPLLRTARWSGPAARALHYLFGVAFAGAYVAAHRRVPAIGSASGVSFGIALFLLSDRVLIPTLKLGRPWARYSRSERANALVSHVAYGIVLERARTILT